MNCVVRWADIKHEWEPFENVFCGSDWPFHLEHNVSHESLIRRFEEQEFSEPNNRVAFIHNDGEHVGIAVVHGLQDATAEIDIRIVAKYRNQGIGSIALIKLTDLIFESKSSIIRVEGNTRSDNIAMRRAFNSAGWVHEAHYREAGVTVQGIRCDVMGYAVIRSDWESGERTIASLGE